MAVTAVLTRTRRTDTVTTSIEYMTAALTGTYVTGGFASNLLAVAGGLGTSPLSGTLVVDVDWRSPLGYIYRSSTAYVGRTATTTTKIFTAANTELANGAAVPEASVLVVVTKTKI